MGPGRYPIGIVKRIEVDPSDVRITTLGFAATPLPPAVRWMAAALPPPPGRGLAILKRSWGRSTSPRSSLLAVAVAAVAFHFLVTPRVGSYTFRQVSWVVAFAQALVAMGAILLVVFTTLVAILIFGFLVLLVIGGVAALLGDRR